MVSISPLVMVLIINPLSSSICETPVPTSIVLLASSNIPFSTALTSIVVVLAFLDRRLLELVSLFVDEVEVFRPEGHDRKIMFDEESGIIMNYPGMKEFVDREFLRKDMQTQEVYDFIATSIDQIFQGEDVYDSSTTTKKEFREFVENLTTKQFEKIQQFYATAPKLSHKFTVINPNTGVESEFTIEGLQNFFA